MCSDSSMWYMMFYWLFGCCFTQTDGTKPQGSIVWVVRRVRKKTENFSLVSRVVSVPFPPPPSHLLVSIPTNIILLCLAADWGLAAVHAVLAGGRWKYSHYNYTYIVVLHNKRRGQALNYRTGRQQQFKGGQFPRIQSYCIAENGW